MQLKNTKKIIIYLLIASLVTLFGYAFLKVAVTRWYRTQYSVPPRVNMLSAQPRILVVWFKSIGEQETIERMKITAKRLGIDLRVASTHPRFYIRWFVKDPVVIAQGEFKPDFLLTIQDWLNYFPGTPNYMTLTLGTDRYISIDQSGKAEIIVPEQAKFDALLPSFQDIDLLKQAYERNGKQFIGFPWYPTVYVTDYEPAYPKKLFYSGGFLWDVTRGSDKYKQLFTMLDRSGYFVVCGPKHKWKHAPNSNIGMIPIDGHSLIDQHHKAGVALVLHAQQHIDGGAPTARIFEAAAANAVIIADRHPFIIKNFGDNVLYIDIDQDAATMFQQIDDHMQWIYAHPNQAQQMAANCNAIYKQKFSLEEQMTKLLDMHRSYSASIEVLPKS